MFNFFKLKKWQMNRRGFIENLAKGSATLIVFPVALSSCQDPIEDMDDMNNPDATPDQNLIEIDLTLNQNSSLLSSGGFIVKNDIIVINTGSAYIALSSVCTHSGCTVSYNASNGDIPCGCHGSLFSISGSVLQGPADAPLKKYSVEQEGDILAIN
jgi:cytochrome b6-f complex iron-sulfur subunit